jgi:hypothetical protein
MNPFFRFSGHAFWRRLPVALLVVTLIAPSLLAQQAATRPATAISSQEREASAQVKIATLRDVTTALVAKDMEGRGTAQPGADRAAKYLADRFAQLGLKPLGDAGSYQQAIKFKSEQVQADSSFKVGDESLKLKKDFVIAPPFPKESQDVSGNLMFVSYSLVPHDPNQIAQELDQLSHKLGDVDVKGKIVFVLSEKPKNVDAATWAKAANQMAVFGRLIAKGAAALVVPYAGRNTQPFPLVATYLTRRRVALADAGGLPIKIPPIVLVNDATAEKLFAASGMTYAQAKERSANGEFMSPDLNKSAAVSVKLKREEGTSNNVVGVLEGSDPKLKDEALVYTAHYDAYGIEADGTIYPGAADNAIGVAKLVAIAEAFVKAKVKPRRSIIFIALTGEEYGLLGAEYWVKHPTWPIEKVAANINYDGIGTELWGPLKTVIDYGFTHSDLGSVMGDVATARSLTIIPDPFPEEGVFYRSDHYSFFKKGVPSLYLIGGTGGDTVALGARAMKWLVTDYHMATDTIRPDWDWDGARELAVVGLVVGMRVANQDAMPAWSSSSPYNRPRGTNLPPPPR